MTKVAVISPESIDDYSGGSIYLRGVIRGLKNTESNVSIYCKNGFNEPVGSNKVSDENIVKYQRTKFKDIISLLFFQMTFLSFHAFDIVRRMKKNKVDIVFIHGDKLWIMVILIALFLRKPVVVMSDNVEYLLGFQMLKEERSYLKKIKYLIFTLLAYLSESISLKFSSVNTFITNYDFDQAKNIYNLQSDSVIWPVTLEGREKLPIREDSESYALFTGSFRFPPNIKAAVAAVELCESLNIKLVLAGLDACDLPVNSNNVRLVDSPSHYEMQDIFDKALVFISPVCFGSGMKTKVAEALKCGLPLICSAHSLIGYDEIQNEGFIVNIENKNQIIKFIKLLKGNSFNQVRLDAFNAFNKNYSDQRSQLCAELVFEKLGVK